MPEPLQIDRRRSWIEVLTFAEGMLSAVAHDLCLRAEGIEGTCSLEPTPQGSLRIPVAALLVRGVQRNGTVDEHSPSGIERREIERRIRQDVFPGTNAIEVSVEGTVSNGRATVAWRKGRTVVPLTFALRENEAEWHCTGETELSLKGLQIAPILGPLRAFRVKDTVRIRWEVHIPKGANQS